MHTMHWIAAGFLFVILLRNRFVIGRSCGTADKHPAEASGMMMLIIDGKDAELGMFPWVGFLSFSEPDNIKCTISLIEPKLAITAAHCVHKKCVNNAFGVFGIANIKQLKGAEKKHVFKVKNFFYPKIFKQNGDGTSAVNDVALLEFEKPVDIASFKGNVNTVCLPEVGHSLDGDLFLTGWGMTNRSSVIAATNLQYMVSDILPKKDCKEPTKFCVKGKKDSQTPFKGDSGGPAVKLQNGRYTLYGVLSGGNTINVSYYTLISGQLSWIKDHKPEDTENPQCERPRHPLG